MFYFHTLLGMVFFAKFKRFAFMNKLPGLLLILLAFISCNKDETFQIGSKYLEAKTNIRYLDSLTVLSYTVKLDSVRTSGLETPAMLIGKQHDPEFGEITATSYFRINPPTSLSIPNNAVYDSLVLILLYNNYAVGDTNVPYTINVHRLQDKLKTRSDGYLYNTSSFAYFPELLGTVSLMPRPNTYDTLGIKLDDNLGNELFNLIMDEDQLVKESELFHNYFRGFALTYDDADNGIVGFNFPTAAVAGSGSGYFPLMRLYYHYFDFTTLYKYVDFQVGSENRAVQFNQIGLSNPMVDFPDQQRDKLPAQESDNSTYIQAGTGIVTRLEIPFLKSLLALHENILIMKAEIQIEPVRDSYFTYPLPDNISVYSCDRINRFSSSFASDGSLTIDKIYQEETWYTFDVTDFVKAKLREESDEVPSLLVTVKPEGLYSTINRVLLGSQMNRDNGIKLKIYYINYQ